VKIATTPGMARAASVSTRSTLAWAYGLRTKAHGGNRDAHVVHVAAAAGDESLIFLAEVGRPKGVVIAVTEYTAAGC
jgi:hypothetical protein